MTGALSPSQPKRFLLLAGEASGDILGGKLLAALKKNLGTENIVACGVAGAHMQEQGCKSLFPLEELSLMGLAEIIPHIPRLYRRIDQVVQFAESWQPDVIITIDAPAFNIRVIKRLHKLRQQQKLHARFIHYVAPSVWAWKPRRAETFSKLFDRILCLLPFEPAYFTEKKAVFIGHSILESGADLGDAPLFRTQHNIPPQSPVLGILPGSRRGEIKRLLPIFKETAENIYTNNPHCIAVIPAVPALAKEIRDYTATWKIPVIVSDNGSEKYNLFAACDVALAASGTVSLELAMAGVPSVIGYKIHPLTYHIVKRLIKVRYASLINILQNDAIFPEFLQNECTAENLTFALQQLLFNENKRQAFQQNCAIALKQLRASKNTTPSESAAKAILEII